MSVIRVKKDKNNPYFLLNRSFLEDANISLRLKGFIAYCMSKPDDWKFHVRQLASVLKEGKDAIYSIIDEGIEHSYIERSEQKVNGKFEGVDYIIHETKVQKITTVSGNPDTDIPDTASPEAEGQTLLINNTIVSNEERKTPPTPSRGQPPDGELVAFGRFVKLKKEDHQALCDKFGELTIKELIEEMNDWLAANGEKYKDYAAAIRMWMSRRKSNPQGTNNRETWIDKLKERVKNHREIYVGEHCVSFTGGVTQMDIKYTEHAYQQQIINRLRKMNISVEGL